MDTFMMICRFREGTAMDEVFAVVAEEQAQVKVLEAEGRIGSIHLSLARGTVFIETFAEDPEQAEATIRTLPMAQWWDLDLYPLTPAQSSGAES
ncbi:MAG: muconolactone Delta-isomerase family protein [Actinomycetes bacterium]